MLKKFVEGAWVFCASGDCRDITKSEMDALIKQSSNKTEKQLQVARMQPEVGGEGAAHAL